MLKETAHHCIVIHRSGVHCPDSSRKGSSLTRLLLTELGLLQPNQQHALIKVSKQNTCVSAIHQDLDVERGGRSELTKASILAAPGPEVAAPGLEVAAPGPARPIVIPLKSDNQGSIALTHNSVFHSRTKHINIQHHYIRDEVAARRVELSYVPTDQMIANGLTKALTLVKFHGFIDQMRMT